MSLQEPAGILCPYCGEAFEILVDTTIAGQHCIEDCQVCCRPITLHIRIDADGWPEVTTRREDD